MSREIKCQWWDKEEKMMLGQKLDSKYQINVSSNGELYLVDMSRVDEDGYDYEMDVEWRQYTGRQDKNGKDIYHKDIWQFHSVNYTVEWKEEDAGFYLKHPDKNATWDDHMDMSDSKGGTLIGNTYEHPHLLGKKGEGQG